MEHGGSGGCGATEGQTAAAIAPEVIRTGGSLGFREDGRGRREEEAEGRRG